MNSSCFAPVPSSDLPANHCVAECHGAQKGNFFVVRGVWMTRSCMTKNLPLARLSDRCVRPVPQSFIRSLRAYLTGLISLRRVRKRSRHNRMLYFFAVRSARKIYRCTEFSQLSSDKGVRKTECFAPYHGAISVRVTTTTGGAASNKTCTDSLTLR